MEGVRLTLDGIEVKGLEMRIFTTLATAMAVVNLNALGSNTHQRGIHMN